MSKLTVFLTCLVLSAPAVAADVVVADAPKITLQMGVRVPLRDGVNLSAIAYLPKGAAAPGPCLFNLSPYMAQTYHEWGTYFAEHGIAFVAVDVRGRGDSGGVFRPMIQEAKDGYDVTEWLAARPYCNGKVGMWGGSYTGYDQWATAKEKPPHLVTIVPAAAAHAGVDFPARNNIFSTFVFEWLTMTSGHGMQESIAGDRTYWGRLWRERFEQGKSFDTIDQALGSPPPMMREWLDHPEVSAYYDSYSPTPKDYATLDIPVLTITGSFDADQPGALAYYDEHMRYGSPSGRARHFLVIGPWDHAGTHTSRAEAGGVKFGPAALLDLNQLHLDWYRWAMAGGKEPAFLQKRVAYYVMGADRWRYADTLDGVTAKTKPYFLASAGDANRLFASGALVDDAAGAKGKPDKYVYDPRDVSLAGLETTLDPESKVDQQWVYANDGKQLVYHSTPFAQDTEVTGFFKLSAWLSINQPDTDFMASVYEIDKSGESILLSTDLLRARYRESQRNAVLVTSAAPLRYDFNHFTYISRRIAKGSRLRLVLGPINSINTQKNYNSGGVVSAETMKDARPVTVSLLHSRRYPSALFVPFGQPD
jgi:putative CocE/NonD family hydrolase